MLREFIDTATLEDFADGLARSGGWRVAVYDHSGRIIAASQPQTEFSRLAEGPLSELPQPLTFTPLPADQPPASVAFVEHRGVWQIIAPVRVGDRLAGFVSVGDLRDSQGAPPAPPAGADPNALRSAWESLPVLERSGESRCVAASRWAARLLVESCRVENQLRSAAEEISIVADIGELLGGERDLQVVLDRIVAETARAMKCRYCSLRLYDAAADTLSVVASHNLTGGYASSDVRRRADAPIDDEALSGRMVYIEDAQSDPRIPDPAHARQIGIVSGLVTGVFYHDRPIGVLRVYADHRRRFRIPQRNLLRAVASQAGIAIVNARLLEERLRSVELERQLEIAGQVQSRMVRSEPTTDPRVESAALFEPSSHVGGDFCDIFPLPNGSIAAAIGDVVGHGVPAALLMASLRGALRSLAETGSDIAEMMNRLNKHVYRETSPAEFVTLLIAALEPASGRLTYCSAGHEPPLVARDGAVHSFDEGGLVLGLHPDETYDCDVRTIAPGELVLLYTDGVIEAMDFAGNQFGRERLVEALLAYSGAPADRTLRQIRWDIRRFAGLAEQSDDITLLALRRR